MTHTYCRQLDDYLAHNLAEDERAAFAGHLPDCPACRQAVGEQEQLDQRLRAATALLESPPADLVARIEGQLRAARRRRLTAWAAGLAAVIALACVTGWLFTREPPGDGSSPVPIVEAPAPPPQPESPDPRSLVRVTFQPEAEVIAVPLKTESPNVTIIWVYPTVPQAEQSKLMPFKSPLSPERNGT
jgi:hypothetical protein